MWNQKYKLQFVTLRNYPTLSLTHFRITSPCTPGRILLGFLVASSSSQPSWSLPRPLMTPIVHEKKEIKITRSQVGWVKRLLQHGYAHRFPDIEAIKRVVTTENPGRILPRVHGSVVKCVRLVKVGIVSKWKTCSLDLTYIFCEYHWLIDWLFCFNCISILSVI